MTGICMRCGAPIRSFKGYDPDIGEICFTCYLEMLQAPGMAEGKTVRSKPQIS